MKRHRILLTSILVAFFYFLSTSANSGEITKIYTSPTPPISMPAGTGGAGIAYKAVEEMMKRAHVDIPIIFGEWSNVYNKALTNRGAAIFPMVMTSDRRNDFIWVGPIAGLDYYIYKPQGSNITVNGMEDIRNAKSIATVKGYAVNQTLKDSGCTNLHYFDTPEAALNSLLNGATSIGIFPDASVNIFLKDMSVKGSKRLIPIHMFMKRNLYYGLNKQTSPEIAILMQKALINMAQDGTLTALYKEYMPKSRQPKIPPMPVFPNTTVILEEIISSDPIITDGKGVKTIKSNVIKRDATSSVVMNKKGAVVSGSTQKQLTIYAEEFPPFTFSVNNSTYIQGAVAELVSAIQKELGQTPAPISLSEWNSIFYTAKTTPYSVICTLKRTPERENDFYWIGPYAADSAWLYARRDSPLQINSLSDAKQIPVIACVGGAYAGSILSNLGFSNLMPYSTPDEAVNDMMRDPSHASAFSSITEPYVLRNAGHSAINVKPLIQISKKTNYYIGISKLTPKEIAIEWQRAFESLKAKGTVKMLMQRWIK